MSVKTQSGHINVAATLHRREEFLSAQVCHPGKKIEEGDNLYRTPLSYKT
jgi:hypothetical protein